MESYVETSRLRVDVIPKNLAKSMIEKYHYTHAWTSCRYAVGLFYETDNEHSFFDEKEEKLIGVAVYGYPVGRLATTSISEELKSEEELLVYGYHQEDGFQYYLYKDLTNDKKIIGKDDFYSDGHPSFIKNSQFILTDTYPDKYGEQHLLLFNMQSKSLQKINQFFSPLRFRGEIRCDLHPRISPSGRLTCLDTVHNNNREMLVISLANFLNNRD